MDVENGGNRGQYLFLILFLIQSFISFPCKPYRQSDRQVHLSRLKSDSCPGMRGDLTWIFHNLSAREREAADSWLKKISASSGPPPPFFLPRVCFFSPVFVLVCRTVFVRHARPGHKSNFPDDNGISLSAVKTPFNARKFHLQKRCPLLVSHTKQRPSSPGSSRVDFLFHFYNLSGVGRSAGRMASNFASMR